MLKPTLTRLLHHPAIIAGTLRSCVCRHGMAVVLICLATAGFSQPAFLEGNWNNGSWINNIALSDRGAVLMARVQANGSASRDFLFNNSGSSYNPQWTGSTSNYLRTTGSRLSGAVYYYTTGGWNNNLQFTASDGVYYTFIVGKNSGSNNDLAILATSYSPVAITAVDAAPAVVSPGQTLNVKVTLAGTLQGSGATAENAWLRYTTNNWATSSFIQVTGFNAAFQGSATIPASANTAGTTVQYYALTTGNNTTPTQADADYQSLNIRNAAGQNTAGSNFSYTVASGWTTAANGNWSSAATWTANAVPPASGSLGVVNIGHNVTLDQNATATTLNLNAGTFTASGSATLSVSGTATITNAATFTNSSSNAANISIANFVVSNGGTYNHDATGSTLNGATNDFPGSSSRSFGATSNVVIKKWANGGSTPVALPATGSPGWGNLTIDVASLGGSYWKQYGAIANVQGDFTIKSTGPSRELRLYEVATGSISTLPQLTVNGNLALLGGNLSLLGGSVSGSASTLNVRINGNIVISGGTLNLTGSNGFTNYLFFYVNYCNVYLKGNLSIVSPGKLTQPKDQSVVVGMFFVKSSGTQYVSSYSGGVDVIYVGFAIGDGSTIGNVTLQTSFDMTNVTTTSNLFYVFANSTLNASGENFLRGNTSFQMQAGAIIRIGSADGITSGTTQLGNIRTTGGRSYHNGANYIYSGAYNQVMGNGLPTTITGSLSIANTGASSNNIVTLTNNNTETKTLNLNSGYFAAGTGQTLKISNNGTVNGSGGGDCVYLTANGGNIHLLGNNTVTGVLNGSPHFYDVTIGSGIANSPSNFLNNGTIFHYCTINSEGAVNPNAPTYATGSTLIYNSGNSAASPYKRTIEWGQATAGAPGYPWHVVVQNSTNLDLGNSTPPLLECGGNLTIGILGGGAGTVNMNALSQPLVVKGHLTIGDTLTGSPTGTLNLSTTYGGDLWLYGNFSRGKNSSYNDNSRAIYFKGSGDATINTPVVAITPGVPTQYFSYTRIEKNNGTENITLNCPVGITQELSLTKGIVTTSSTNLLSVTNGSSASIVGGSNLSFVNGPLGRAVNATAEYDFPVGKTGGLKTWRPVAVKPASSSSGTFRAEYFSGPTPNNTSLLSNISSLEDNEYWQLDRTSGSTAAVVKLNYENPGTGSANWTPVDPCATCQVAVAQYNTSGAGYWEFTKNPATADPVIPEIRNNTSDGSLYSTTLNAFSLQRPLTAAAYYDIILPVQLIQFSGRPINNHTLLDWTVTSPGDVAFFEIRYSTDGIHWSTLATIRATGSRDYRYEHETPQPGRNFYRLVVAGKNGEHQLSKVLIILYQPQAGICFLSLAPNPAANHCRLVLYSSAARQGTITLMDLLGKRLFTKLITLEPASNYLDVLTATLAPGTYLLQVATSDGFFSSQKLVKQ